MTKVKDSQTGKVNKSHWAEVGSRTFGWKWKSLARSFVEPSTLSWYTWLPPLLQSLPGACSSECHVPLAYTDDHLWLVLLPSVSIQSSLLRVIISSGQAEDFGASPEFRAGELASFVDALSGQPVSLCLSHSLFISHSEERPQNQPFTPLVDFSGVNMGMACKAMSWGWMVTFCFCQLTSSQPPAYHRRLLCDLPLGSLHPGRDGSKLHHQLFRDLLPKAWENALWPLSLLVG